MKAAWLFTILFLACGTANCQSLRVLPVQIHGGQGFPAAIQFYCTEKYSRKDCQNDIFNLRQALSRYPMELLGLWSFVVASTDEWEAMMSRLNLPPESPVFSALKGNTTVISQALFSASADRRAEMMKMYGVPANQLLDVAMSHELAHAFCRELDESRAKVNGELLRTKRTPQCRPHQERRQPKGNGPSITSLSASCFPREQAPRPSGAAGLNEPQKMGGGTH